MAKSFVHPTRSCIYCLVEKPSKAFNKEHVIPQLMGLFEQGQTIKAVCKDCNTYFGRYVDPVFAEDSYEAILRIQQGVKTTTALYALRYERLNITVPGDGWWAGARLKLKDFGGTAKLDFPAQMGFYRRSTQKYEYFLLSELDDVDWTDFDTKNWKILAVNQEDEEKLKNFCLNKISATSKFSPQPEELPTDGTEMEVDLTSRIDELVKRAVCKIAFNYLAKQLDWRNHDLLRSTTFDDIRNFARSGILLASDRVNVSTGNENSILKLPPNQGVYAHLSCP